jgi:hypothetical protein
LLRDQNRGHGSWVRYDRIGLPGFFECVGVGIAHDIGESSNDSFGTMALIEQMLHHFAIIERYIGPNWREPNSFRFHFLAINGAGGDGGLVADSAQRFGDRYIRIQVAIGAECSE